MERFQYCRICADLRREIRFLPALLLLIMALATVPLFAGTSEASAQQAGDKSIRRSRQTSPGATLPVQGQQADQDLRKGDLYALVVGVSNYLNPNVPKLNYSDADARAFGEFLKTQSKVFKKTHVTLLVNEQATKKDLEKCLQYELLKAGKDDTVMVFFSGHGAGDVKKPGDYYFLGYDAEPDYLGATAVKMSGLNFLKRLDARRVVLIADACHAGAFSQVGVRTKSLDKSLDSLVRAFRESSGKVIMTSSKPEELSQEKENLRQSVFTHFLIKGLRGEADTDRNGVVTLREAYDYAYEQTKNETDGAQHPQLEGTVVGSFPVSVLGNLDGPIRLEVSFIAQDPRCTNRACTDPTEDAVTCTDPLCGDVELKDGDTMYSGQNYQIAIRPSEASYVYAYHVGPQGDLYRLFPGRDYLAPENRLANPLKGGKIYWIPAKDRWLRQDEQQGKEKIYIVASRSRNGVLEDLYGHLEKIRSQAGSGNRAKKVQTEIESYLERTMAPTKTIVKKVEHRQTAAQSDAKIQRFEMLARIFEAAGLDAVRSVWFWHERK